MPRELSLHNLLNNWLGIERRGRLAKRAIAPVPIPPLDPITITKKISKKFKKLGSDSIAKSSNWAVSVNSYRVTH